MAINAVSPQQIPHLKVPFRSRFNLSFSNNFTTYPDIVKPICKSIKFEAGDTIDVSVDLNLMYLYLKSPIIDGLQADLYAIFTRYSQVSNKYKRVRGERLSVASDEREYVMPRITSIYPILWGIFTNGGEVGSGRLYADALKWKQDGEEIVPQVFDITTGKNIDPVLDIQPSSHPSGYRVLNGYHLPYDDISLRPSGFNDSSIYGFMLGTLPEALGYGCGTPFMAYSAVDILAYYLSCDYYFRNAEIFDSIVGLVPDVDVNRPWNIWSDWQGMVPYYDYAYGSIKQFLYPEGATDDQNGVSDYKLLSSYTAFNRLTGLAPGGFYRASRKPDYQALGLASPTYGGIDVLIPGMGVEGTFPVVGDGKPLGLENKYGSQDGVVAGLRTNPDGVFYGSYPVPEGNLPQSQAGSIAYANMYYGVSTDPTKSGLQVEIGAGGAGTMLELRSNFQLLKFLEAKNRSGKYFTDLMNNLFGIQDKRPDERFPELLGVLSGSFNFIPNIQTSGASDTPQGNITTNAMCRIKGKVCHKTALEDGILQLLLVIRQPSITLPNRIDKRLFEFREMDFMQPLFARLGDQPVLNYEVNMPLLSGYLFGNSNLTRRETAGTVVPTNKFEPSQQYYTDVQDKIFDVNSYQERYGELKYSFNQVSDIFNPRSAKVPCYIQPLYQKYLWRDDLGDFVISNFDGPQLQGGICRLVPSLTPWSYVLGFDAGLSSSNVGYLSNLSQNKSSSVGLASDFPDRTDPRLSKSITPFGKNSASLEMPPFEGQVMVYITADRILPVNSAPGLADHF